MKLPVAKNRVQLALALCLALLAGYLDGYALLILRIFVSFMSGNTTITGISTGQGHFHAALPSATAIVSFVIGSFVGNLFTQSRLRYSHRMIFGVIAGLLATGAGLERLGLSNHLVEMSTLSLATGMMNPALTKIRAEPVSLTFITGTLNRLGGHLASVVVRKPLPEGQGSRDSHIVRAGIDASIWLGFLTGAVLAAVTISHSRTWPLIPPCVAMIALGLFSPADDATASPEETPVSKTSAAIIAG